ncbi:hypothetical protein, partial [Eudoraea sp.]|uniref:hypothetical protein n=1 Tax=Eudoraea sp. TaxID=1979955 RepID=UPI003C7683C4
NSITADKLAPDSVGSEELQDNTVADAEIDYNQVTLNDFNNDAGFITGAQIVSPAPNNSISDNTGAFYDNTPLQNDIAANAAAIAADGDTDSGNEFNSGIALNGTSIELTDLGGTLSQNLDGTFATDAELAATIGGLGPIVSNNTPNSIISGTDGGALFNAIPLQDGIDANAAELLLKEDLANKSPDINLGTSNDLYPSQNAVKVYVDSQVGGSAQSIGEVLTVGNDAGANSIINLVDSTDPTSAATRSYVDSQVSNGAIISNNLNVTGGVNALFGNVTIDIPNDAINAAMLNADVVGAGLLQNAISGALEIEPGTNGQFLSTDAGGNIAWTILPVTGGNQTLLEVLTLGNDAGANSIVNLLDSADPSSATTRGYVDSQVADGSETIIDPTLSTIGVTGIGTTASPYVLTGGGSVEEADGITITGIGTNLDPFKIEPGANGQFLNTDTGGNVIWADLPPSAVNQNLTEVLALGNNAGALQIENLLDPDDNQDAATKKYVDDNIVAAGGGVPTDELNFTFGVNAGNIEITDNGGTLAIPLTEINTDSQTLNIIGSDLIITGGNSVPLPTSDGSETIINDSGTVTVAGTGTVG